MNPSQALGRLRDVIRTQHCTYRTEKTYLHWARRFLAFCGGRPLASLGAPQASAARPGESDGGIRPIRPVAARSDAGFGNHTLSRSNCARGSGACAGTLP